MSFHKQIVRYIVALILDAQVIDYGERQSRKNNAQILNRTVTFLTGPLDEFAFEFMYMSGNFQIVGGKCQDQCSFHCSSRPLKSVNSDTCHVLDRKAKQTLVKSVKFLHFLLRSWH